MMAPVVLGKYQDIMDDYFMTAYGTKERQPRWETCIGSTLGAFGYALSRPFVEEVYDRTAKAMVKIKLGLYFSKNHSLPFLFRSILIITVDSITRNVHNLKVWFEGKVSSAITLYNSNSP